VSGTVFFYRAIVRLFADTRT